MKLTFCSKAGFTPSKTHLLNLRFCINKIGKQHPMLGHLTEKIHLMYLARGLHMVVLNVSYQYYWCQNGHSAHSTPDLLASSLIPAAAATKPLSVAPNRCTHVQPDNSFSTGPSLGLLTSHLRLLCSCHAEILGTHIHATQS